MLKQWGYQNQTNASHSAPMAKTVDRAYWHLRMELDEPLFSFSGAAVGGGSGFATWTANLMPP
jgi:hypothetical protein